MSIQGDQVLIFSSFAGGGAGLQLLEAVQFWKVSQDLRQSCRAGKARSGQHIAEAKD